MAAAKVIVDTDPATGYPLADVDDGLALLYLLAYPKEFNLLGITTVYGNASLPKTTSKAEEILRVARRTEIPVLPGAASSKQLGADTRASGFLRESVASQPGKVTILALGPLTNVAAAGFADPDFYSNVKRIVIMGGALEEGYGLPLIPPLEFNFFKDPIAADSVLGAKCEKVVISADLCRQAVFTRRELTSLWRMGNPVATYLAYRIRPWLRLNQIMPFVPWRGGFVPWDVVAAVYLRRQDLFSEIEERGMRLRQVRFTTGALEPDPSRDERPTTVPRRQEPQAMLDNFLAGINE
ncbi:MAG: nucleoside hydrolase, partial [Actinobacteria bacterium]|nr:nucleoside hydrolase [Actinomycetota bacterium]